MAKRSKRRRLTYVSSRQRPDLPAIFESLNDDTLTTVLEFVGKKSYRSFGGLNKHCREIYLATKGMKKKTFLYGYAPLAVIQDRYNRTSSRAQNALSKGVVYYNRRDVLNWALQEYDEYLLRGICDTAAKEGRIDLLIEVWNNIDDADRRFIFEGVDVSAARGGKLNVLKWFDTKGLSIGNIGCALVAARHGQLHIIQWLKEEKGLVLDGGLYNSAARGSQLNVMKWLREQEVDWPFHQRNFRIAAEKGNLDILQWLHDEGCPWPEGDDLRVLESQVKPEALSWLRANGYGNRIW